MLSAAAVLALSEPVEKMYIDAAAQLVINIAAHFKGGNNLSTRDWQIKKLSEMGQLTRENAAIIAANTGQSEAAITAALEKAAGMSIADAEKTLQAAVAAGKLQGLIGDSGATWQTSKRVQTVIGNLAGQAQNDLNLVNTVMLQSSMNRYQTAIARVVALTEKAEIERMFSIGSVDELAGKLDLAQTALNKAAGSVALSTATRQQAVGQAVKEMAAAGITGYIDRAGHHWTPEAYVNMDVRTTVHNTALQGQRARSADYGVDTFQISTKAMARPKCAPYQGWVCSWGNWSGEIEDLYGNKIPVHAISETSYGEPDGIFGINCGHTANTFVPGYSVARYSELTPEELRENAEQYALSQQQREIERQIRQSKTEALAYDAAGLKKDFDAAALKIKDKQAAYDEFCAQNGLTPRKDRTQVYGYNRSVSGKVSASVAQQRAAAAAAAAAKPATAAPATAAAAPKVAANEKEFIKRLATKDNDYTTLVQDKFAAGNETVKEVWRTKLPAGNVVDDYNFNGAQYSPSSKSIKLNMAEDKNNPRGNGVTFFHEHGHAIDDATGRLSHDAEFTAALKEDLKALRTATGAKGVKDQDFAISMQLMAKEAALDAQGAPDKYNGVSDILDGLTSRRASGHYGHSQPGYWQRPYSVEQEAFAHMTEAAFIDGQHEAIEEYFPKSYAKYLELMESAK